jgi:hypothetical protein
MNHRLERMLVRLADLLAIVPQYPLMGTGDTCWERSAGGGGQLDGHLAGDAVDDDDG